MNCLLDCKNIRIYWAKVRRFGRGFDRVCRIVVTGNQWCFANDAAVRGWSEYNGCTQMVALLYMSDVRLCDVSYFPRAFATLTFSSLCLILYLSFSLVQISRTTSALRFMLKTISFRTKGTVQPNGRPSTVDRRYSNQREFTEITSLMYPRT